MQPETQSARSRRSYRKIEDCEQSILLTGCNSIIKLGDNHAMKLKYTHGTLSSKTQRFPLIKKRLFGPQQRKKKTSKQERKANRIITLKVENS